MQNKINLGIIGKNFGYHVIYKAFLKNKHYVVPGKGNFKFAFLPRILSRAKVLKFTGDAFKKHSLS